MGKDVAEILGYANTSKALIDHVDDEDKLNNETLSSLGQRGGWLINESGLYSLILSSKLPNAKKFKYKNGYERDVMYKQFCNIDYDTKMNCDYVIHKDNEDYYIEIAGILHSEKDLDKVNMGKRKEIYRQKMNKKIDALSKSNVKSLILYSYDMKTGKYKEIVNNFLGIKEVKQCQSVANE